MKVLQVSSADLGGGAERVAWSLFDALRQAGHESWLAVGRKRSADPNVFVVPNAAAAHAPARPFLTGAQALQTKGRYRAARAVRALGQPGTVIDELRGREDFRFRGTWKLPDVAPAKPDVLHLHNLHGYYFDLRALPRLSARLPVVWSLHDLWALTGHCAHPLDHERWTTGCGDCPHLRTYPALRRDGTAANWRRKRDIYAQSRVQIVTPSRALADDVRRSMLAPAAAGVTVIPYGIDLGTFAPGDRGASRARLGLPIDATILVFAANGIRRSDFKDYATLRAALAQLRGDVRLIALGEDAPPEQVGESVVQFVPLVRDPAVVADYLRAADVYVHPAVADTFPLAVLEALACGTAVVASAVGGIPEQIDATTGVLVPPREPDALAAALVRVLDDVELRTRLGAAAASSAAERFGLERMLSDYLEVYANGSLG